MAGFDLDDTHAAGRVRFAGSGGRPSTEMLERLGAAIPRWSKEAITYCVVMEGGDPFCAGWDLDALRALPPAEAQETLARSYALAWQIDCFTKPIVPLIDGVVSGAGAAFTLYGTHRIAGPRYRFQAAGTQAAWFPDHGLTHVLAQLPGHMGTYLALTRASLGPADAYRLGLVTHCIKPEAFPGIVQRLCDADPVDPILDDLHQLPAASELEPHSDWIAQCFGAESVEAILERLAGVTGVGAVSAQAARDRLAAIPAPISALTLRLLRENRHVDLREALIRDYRVACRLLARDATSAPEAAVELLAKLGAGDIDLPTRAQMQAPVL